MLILLSLYLMVMSSIYITSTFESKKNNFLYVLLIIFAQVILNFEILSLINSILVLPFLIFNVITFVLARNHWRRKNKPTIEWGIKEEFNKITKALKQDKLLYILSIFFILFLIVEFITIYLFQTSSGDALMYNFTRCTGWIQNLNLNHVLTPDTRINIMPINLELLYTWYFLFLKTERGVTIFQFIGYITAIYVLYNFLGNIGYSRRKRIWSVLVLSSFVLIGIMAYTPYSDVFVGALLFSSIYLFYLNCKEKDNTALYFSTLSLALAIGTKTTALMSLPAIGMLFLFIANKYKNFKAIKSYSIFFILNFLIFSSFNYILNFINYGNPITTNMQYMLHEFRGGFKGYFTNLIKYCFLIFDCSGIQNIDLYNKLVLFVEEKVLNLFGANLESYTSKYLPPIFVFNSTIGATASCLGAMGLFTLLPSIFKSFKNGFKKNKGIITVFAIILILNILIYSKAMVYSKFNTRYLMTFIVISSPILVLSYIKSNKNLFKWFLSGLIFLYLVIIPYTRPVELINFYSKYKQPNQSILDLTKADNEEINVFNYLKANKAKSVALFAQNKNTYTYFIGKLRFYGIKVDTPLVENIEDYNFDKYEYIVITREPILAVNIATNKSDNVICTYLDKNQNVIDKSNEKDIAMISCLSPLDYLKNNDFYIVKDFGKYIILK
ncbi:MAG: glycosyltransferase family 39 protein [Candidatus Gastranaerophilales bacterium]|nr:glycosyltransferase family 39 protein [Candidatus Gastranaerophilales bacterium]